MLDQIRNPASVVDDEMQEQAVRSLVFGLALPRAWSTVRDLLRSIAPRLEHLSHREEWIVVLEKGVQQSIEHEDLETEADLRFYLGVLLQQRSRLGEASAQLIASASVAQVLEMRSWQARALNRLAFVSRLRGDLEEATGLVKQALSLDGISTEDRAYGSLVLGAIAYDRRDWDECLCHFQQSLDLWRDVGNPRMEARSLSNMGVALRAHGRYSEAITYLQEAINLFDQVHDPIHQAAARLNQGNAYLSLHRYQDALRCYMVAEAVFRKLQDRLHLASAYHNLGLAYGGLSRWFAAEEALLASIELWDHIGNPSLTIRVLADLAKLYSQQQRLEAADQTVQIAMVRLPQVQDPIDRQNLEHTLQAQLQQISLQFTN